MVAGQSDGEPSDAPATGGALEPLTGLVLTPHVSSRMSRQARKDTAPELALRKELHRRGCRFRKEWAVPGLPRRRIDIAFTRRRVAVFVDGCFWHACPVHATAPLANGAWWSAKLSKNVARDRDTDDHLRRLGWTVVRVWEHETLGQAADRIVSVLVAAGHTRPRATAEIHINEPEKTSSAVPTRMAGSTPEQPDSRRGTVDRSVTM